MYMMCSSTFISFSFSGLCGMFNIRSGFTGGHAWVWLPVSCAARPPAAASLLLSCPTTPSVGEKDAHQPKGPEACCICEYALKTVEMCAEAECQNTFSHQQQAYKHIDKQVIKEGRKKIADKLELNQPHNTISE